MSVAHGGQVVCSQVTAGLVRDREDLRGVAAEAARKAVDHIARTGDRAHVADVVAVATIVLADHPDHFEAAAALVGARHGPVLGAIPLTFAAIHRARFDAAEAHIVGRLGREPDTRARRHGAAMTHDEIVAFTLGALSALAGD
jgi:hypothetical protein